MNSPGRIGTSIGLDQIEEKPPTVTGPPLTSDLTKYKMQTQ